MATPISAEPKELGDGERGLRRRPIGTVEVTLEKQLVILEDQERRRSSRGKEVRERRRRLRSISSVYATVLK